MNLHFVDVDHDVPLDPLLRALIGHLPASGSVWLRSDREAWLKMTAMAFEVVYKLPEADETPVVAPRLQPPRFLLPEEIVGEAQPVTKIAAQSQDHLAYNYYVDHAGLVRSSTSDERVMPSAIGRDDEVYDYRRGADRSKETIVWADESRGVRSSMAFAGPG